MGLSGIVKRFNCIEHKLYCNIWESYALQHKKANEYKTIINQQ